MNVSPLEKDWVLVGECKKEKQDQKSPSDSTVFQVADEGLKNLEAILDPYPWERWKEDWSKRGIKFHESGEVEDNRYFWQKWVPGSISLQSIASKYAIYLSLNTLPSYKQKKLTEEQEKALKFDLNSWKKCGVSFHSNGTITDSRQIAFWPFCFTTAQVQEMYKNYLAAKKAKEAIDFHSFYSRRLNRD